jgi:hypothetical protein
MELKEARKAVMHLWELLAEETDPQARRAIKSKLRLAIRQHEKEKLKKQKLAPSKRDQSRPKKRTPVSKVEVRGKANVVDKAPRMP